MLGTSRTVIREVAREFEFLRIEPRGGTPTYVAQPGGGTATAFGATVVSDTAVTFENLQHDFPQRIIYRRIGKRLARRAHRGGRRAASSAGSTSG
jgi:DNA-binding FadR family transcriptional regulator